jgi:hypothetical protein
LVPVFVRAWADFAPLHPANPIVCFYRFGNIRSKQAIGRNAASPATVPAMTPKEAIERMQAAGCSELWIASSAGTTIRELRRVLNGTSGPTWPLGEKIIELAREELARRAA